MEKEEVIVKLKSELVLLRNQLEMSEKHFETRLQNEIEKYQRQT